MNLIDLFTSIPGPTFLWIFGLLAALCIGLAYFWPVREDSENDPLPAPDLLQPVEIAYLRGGAPAVLQAASYDCWARGEFELRRSGSSGQTVRSRNEGVKSCDEVEARILKTTETECSAHDLLHDERLLAELERCLEPAREKLINRHLLRTDAELRRAHEPFWIALAIIPGVGAVRLYFGLMLGRPVLYLVCLIGLSLCGWYLARKHKAGRRTRLGQRYLKSLEAFYEPIKAQASLNTIPEGMSQALLPAVFGLALLQGIGPFSSFNEAFAPTRSGSPFARPGDSVGSYGGSYGDSGSYGGSDGGSGGGGCGGGGGGGGCGGGGCGGGGCGGGGCGG